MAEGVMVAGVEEIVKRLISFGIDEIVLLSGVKEEVKKLRSVLTKIVAVLQDAEKKQVKNETLRLWLKDLKEVAYDVEDVLDEIAYEDLRQKIIKSKVRNFISSSELRLKIAHKVQRINKRLDDIEKEKNRFSLIKVEPSENDSNSEESILGIRETSSFVDDSTVVGRENEKSLIVNKLIDGSSTNQESNGTLSVIPIVGLGGLGKTTLAQLVYKDEDVKKHFDLRIWICVSDDFFVTSLFTQIFKQISNETECKSSSKQDLQNNLETHLSGKRFLLVLDDVWNEDPLKWDDLILPLKTFGAAGSKIIVTTRNKSVALVVGAQDEYDLQTLSDDNCLAIFERRAFMPGGPKITSNLVAIGKEVVKKCKGVPLAAKVLGGLMHSKKKEYEWLAIKNSEIWNMSDEQNKIIEVLKLSYDNLPPPLRQCFSYCSIFPKDCMIPKETLIQLWMAQGFLKTSGGIELMEDIGDQYFNILYSKSFFQDMQEDAYENNIICKMHDLVHDLAQSVTNNECQIVEATKIDHDHSGRRHLLLILDEIVSTIPKALYMVKKLRTFSLFMPSRPLDSNYYYTSLQWISLGSLFKLRLLRVLDLSHITIEVLPSSIGRLIHLRYLDLSYTNIKVLPPSVTKLYNLQTLKLGKCRYLRMLPENLGNLINLRHLFVDAYRETCMELCETPRGLGKLAFLQTLPALKLCTQSAGPHIAELECLNHLGGSLEIDGLGHVNDATFAKKANLSGKKNLHTLGLKFNGVHNDFQDAVLEALQPHSNLKELRVTEYDGGKFPWWVTNGSALSCLVKLRLSGCEKCEHIKGLTKLPSLKELWLFDMTNLKRLGDDAGEEEVEEAAVAYPCLKLLAVYSAPNLEEWLENGVVTYFPQLKELALSNCPKLRKAPNVFPSLQNLELESVGNVGMSSIASNLTSLSSFRIGRCEDLMFLTREGLLSKNNHLQTLEISYCPTVKSIPGLSTLTLLQELRISSCDELEIIEEACLPFLPALELLHIWYCPKLKIGGETDPFPPHLRLMSLLQINEIVFHDSWASKIGSVVDLHIYGIPKLKELPVEFLQNNEHLRSVEISSCPKFQGFHSSTKEEEALVIHTSLKILRLHGCPAVLPIGLPFQGLIGLQELDICGCTGVKSLEGLQFLHNIEILKLGPFSKELDYFPFPAVSEINHLTSSLIKLEIIGWSNLKSMPSQLQHLRLLKTLIIIGFNCLTALPEWVGELASLKKLIIQDCGNLKHLPSKNAMKQLTSLRALYIMQCPLLKESCNWKGDAEYDKISHIPDIKFDPLSYSY